MAPLTISRVLVVSLFLPFTIAFENDKEKELGQGAPSANVSSAVPKSNLLEDLAARRGSLRPPTPRESAEDPLSKLFPEKNDVEASTAPLDEPSPRRRVVHFQENLPKLGTSYRLFRRRSSVDASKIPNETSWTVQPCHLGNIGLQNAIRSVSDKFPRLLWVGTLGRETDSITDKTRADIRKTLHDEHGSLPVIVQDADFNGHYSQFCKQVLWPTLHYTLPDSPKSRVYEENSWQHYVKLNEQFTEVIAENCQSGDIIWVNDYHLFLVPSMLRKKLQNKAHDVIIGFFLHVPFPSSEIFRCLPERKELLEGVLGADMIGFQTYSFARHFLQTCMRILSLESTPKGVQLENNFVSVGIFPIGIDIHSLNEKRKDPEVAKWVALLKDKYAGKKLLVARDKLDYVKGVRQKMLAFERFLTMHPEWQGKVVLIQVALSTAEQNELQSQVSDVVARINSKFSNIAYQPVMYLHKDITHSQYLALLEMADACLVTSLRDGMNLTSHEYVVCQQERHRPLILSEFAGTYGSFGAAIRINPWDYRECAEAIREALEMPDEDATVRWNELHKHAATNSAQFWAESFVCELEKAHNDMHHRFSILTPHLSPRSFLSDFKNAQKRLFLLDYDGTLVPYERNPSAPASLRYIRTLTKLAGDPLNLVYIMSGRTIESLDDRLGNIPRLGMSAENGSYLKPVDGVWEKLVNDMDLAWQDQVMEIFEYYMERTPGTYIEKKSVSIVWHYRAADNLNYAVWQAAECQNHIMDALGSSYPIYAIAGNMNIEVMPRNVNKAVAISRILTPVDPDFVFCVGDDRTDEDMFEYVNKLESIRTRITCTVSSKSSEANFFVNGVASVIGCLDMLAE